MTTLTINGDELKHVGIPLSAYLLEDGTWGGRSNFIASNETTKTKADLEDLNDCFRWMKKWVTEDPHQGAYVLDFSTRTIYYDTPTTLEHLQQRKIPKRNWNGYFQTFIQKDFSK